MPYTLNTFSGNLLTTVSDGLADTSTNLTLPGPNYVGYGKLLNENLVYLLENFAGNTSPSGTNLLGQLWFDTGHQILNVFTKNGYVPVSGVTVGSLQPIGTKPGDYWFNTLTNQLSLYDGANWNLIGPIYTRAQGVSGAIPITVTDSLGLNHNILQLQYGNVVIATVSGDAQFSPASLSGFPIVNAGITFPNNVNATINSNIIGNLTGNVVAQSISGTLTGHVIGNVTGNLTGSVTGNVVATTLVGSLTGAVNSPSIVVTNFSTANAVIAGGYITTSNVSTGLLTTTNLTTGNAQITGGNIAITNATISVASLQNSTVTNESVTNFKTGNAQITGGNATFTNTTTTNLTATALTAANIVVSGGIINNVNSLSANTATVQNLTTGTISISGGSITGLTNFGSGNATVTNFNTGNAQITGGLLSGVTLSAPVITNANITANTVTQPTNNRTTALATTAYVHNVMPTGMIIMWGGLISNIPAGWQLCDGTNGTPDLRDRFIVGAGNNYNVGDAGGLATNTLITAQLPSHNHAFTIASNTNAGGSHTHVATSTSTVTDPGHRHTESVSASTSYIYNGTNSVTIASSTPTNTGTSSTGVTVATSTAITLAPDHTHAISITGNTNATGTGSSVENRPPYYALCYLQKVY
jgi:hypothetical protein